jgi:hypothetical protein
MDTTIYEKTTTFFGGIKAVKTKRIITGFGILQETRHTILGRTYKIESEWLKEEKPPVKIINAANTEPKAETIKAERRWSNGAR